MSIDDKREIITCSVGPPCAYHLIGGQCSYGGCCQHQRPLRPASMFYYHTETTETGDKDKSLTPTQEDENENNKKTYKCG